MKKWLARQLRELLSVSSENRNANRRKRTLEENEEIVSNVLTRLGSQYDREDLGDGKIEYAFDFQGGRFRLLVSDSVYVKVLFPYFYSVDPDNLRQLRSVCNECNMMMAVLKVVYTFNERGNQYSVHVQSSFSLGGALDTLDLEVMDLLKSIFSFSHRFREVYESQLSNKYDAEEIENVNARSLFLLREQEIHHIMPAYRWRDNASESVTIAQIFSKLFDIPSEALTYLSVARSPRVGEENSPAKHNFYMTDNGDISSYEVLDALISGKGEEAKFVHSWANFSLMVSHPMVAGAPQLYSVLLQSADETKDSLYVRMTVCQAPVPNAKQKMEELDTPNPIVYSFVLAYDRTDPAARLQEFDFMMKDAMDKVEEKRTSELSDEQYMLLAGTDDDMSYALYFGTKLYFSGRYYEALLLLENAYWSLQDKFDENDERFCDRFFQLCFHIGFCYAELRQFQKALYYLQILYPLKSIQYTTEYINCLVNSGEFRAERVVDDLLDNVRKMMEEEDSEEPLGKDVVEFYNFLRRRKIYIQVEHGELDPAEEECKKMLDEPANNSFALSELAYIQSIRREDEEEEKMNGNLAPQE